MRGKGYEIPISSFLSDEGPSPILSSAVHLPPAFLQVNSVQRFPKKECFVKKKSQCSLKRLQQNKENDMSVHGVKRSFGNFEK